MKHKILLFASGYKTSASANGICARNLVREFVKQGHEVYVIAVPYDGETEMEEIDGAKVWFVDHDWVTRTLWKLHRNENGLFSKLLSKSYSAVRALLLAPIYPNISPSRIKKIASLSDRLISEYRIDTIIGTCLPYCGIPAAIQLKKKYGEKIRVVTYHFDILSTPYNKNGLLYSFKQSRFNKAFAKELQIVDRVFLPETAKGLHNDDRISYIGLPVFLPEVSGHETSFVYPKNYRNLAYIGSIGGSNRSLIPVISFLRNLNRRLDESFMLHIWGNISDGTTQVAISDNADIITYHGLIENSEVKSVMMKADYLLNISNAILYRLLPSKMFSMFATGKPIINLVFHPDDCSLPFFEKYGNSIQIRMWKNEPMLPDLKILSDQKMVHNKFESYNPAIVACELLNV